MRRAAIGLGFVAALAGSVWAAGSMGLMIDKLGEVVEGLGLGPVLLSRGQVIGDVQSLTDQSLLARSATCFPKLAEPILDHPAIDEVIGIDADEGTLSAIVSRLFNAKLSAKGFTRFVMRLTDVEVRTVALKDLEAALDPGCAFLKPHLAEGKRVKYGGKTVQVIATIMTGRRHIALLAESGGSGELGVEDVRKLLGDTIAEVIPVGAEAHAEFKVANMTGIVIRSARPEVIAYAPSNIPTFGFLGNGDDTGFEPFDARDEAHRSMLKALSDAQAAAFEAASP